MVELVVLVGIVIRHYEDYMMKCRYCELHLVHVEDTSDVEDAAEDVIGRKVEVVDCPREVDPTILKIGHLYQLDYESFVYHDKKYVRLRGLLPVKEE